MADVYTREELNKIASLAEKKLEHEWDTLEDGYRKDCFGFDINCSRKMRMYWVSGMKESESCSFLWESWIDGMLDLFKVPHRKVGRWTYIEKRDNQRPYWVVYYDDKNATKLFARLEKRVRETEPVLRLHYTPTSWMLIG